MLRTQNRRKRVGRYDDYVLKSDNVNVHNYMTNKVEAYTAATRAYWAKDDDAPMKRVLKFDIHVKQPDESILEYSATFITPEMIKASYGDTRGWCLDEGSMPIKKAKKQPNDIS